MPFILYNMLKIELNQKTKLIKTIPFILEKTISTHMTQNLNYRSIFDSTCIKIKFNTYFERLINFTEAESSTILCSLILLDFLITKQKIVLTNKNIHKLFFMSLYSSLKHQEDLLFSESTYSTISGISIQELAILELNFLELLDYRFPATEEIYKLYHQNFFTN